MKLFSFWTNYSLNTQNLTIMTTKRNLQIVSYEKFLRNNVKCLLWKEMLPILICRSRCRYTSWHVRLLFISSASILCAQVFMFITYSVLTVLLLYPLTLSFTVTRLVQNLSSQERKSVDCVLNRAENITMSDSWPFSSTAAKLAQNLSCKQFWLLNSFIHCCRTCSASF